MNVNIERTTHYSSDRDITQHLSPETGMLLRLGREQNWGTRLLGKAPMPEVPTRVGDWLIVPAQQDTSTIPSRSLARIQAIFAAGIRPQGFVLVHEAPRLLPAPSTNHSKARPVLIPPGRTQPFEKWGQTSLETLGMGAVALTGLVSLAATAIAVLGSLVLPALLLGALALDPILIAVTDDGYWVEIDRWWIEPN